MGMLKRLRGTPIVRHDDEWQMVYSPHAPYELLRNRFIDFATMSRLRRFSRFWDLVANSGNFVETTPLLWGQGSPFDGFMQFSDWLFEKEGQTHGISLIRLAQQLFSFLVEERGLLPEAVAQSVWTDYCRHGRRDKPSFLRPFALESPSIKPRTSKQYPPRQSRHATFGPK